MTEYSFRALDAEGRLTATQVTAFETDEVARLRATIILANFGHPTVEVWDGERLVCRLFKPYRDRAAA
jgi:hypothetical protein